MANSGPFHGEFIGSHGKSMASPWQTRGAQWQIHGKSMANSGGTMANPWQAHCKFGGHHGKSMASPWQIQGAPWQSHGKSMVNSWSPTVNPWQVHSTRGGYHGNSMASPRQIRGVTWQIHGKPLANSGGTMANARQAARPSNLFPLSSSAVKGRPRVGAERSESEATAPLRAWRRRGVGALVHRHAPSRWREQGQSGAKNVRGCSRLARAAAGVRAFQVRLRGCTKAVPGAPACLPGSLQRLDHFVPGGATVVGVARPGPTFSRFA